MKVIGGHVGWVLMVSFPLLLSTSCATIPKKGADSAVGYRQAGLASWYGPGFHGRKTSSGEVFNMYGFTAAHRTLPLGTLLNVKNRENGRAIQVKVNDRGPFIRGRILDLSYGAAKALDMIGSGTVLVEIRAVGREEASVRPEREKGTQGYTVQVGAFVQEENALRLKTQLEKDYRPVYIVIAETEDRRYYRVRVGRLQTEDQADQLASKLSKLESLETFVVRED